ncbi:unnamed protein product [Chondrus crispus]|uniref:Uncharacterized protein n=1 Tax=Chondrus crispus TaxID=2769 RepID=R7QTM0_CHOCR|nr:unnamed protein product [Chondrus crispus]CDF40856.1 unnamed protein product [Chondrus crispus]|eukprot:XP_005711150.1 unnamed protein product [Chondrus crispus]
MPLLLFSKACLEKIFGVNISTSPHDKPFGFVRPSSTPAALQNKIAGMSETMYCAISLM